MVKLFTLTIILSGILIASVICPRPSKPEKSSEPETNQPAENIDDSDTAVINELIKSPPRENASKLSGLCSKSKKSAALIADSRWMLKRFDKSEVNQVEKGEKCWENIGYEVCMYKGSSLVSVSWSNRLDYVQMKVFYEGGIRQIFHFNDYRPDGSRHFDRVVVTIQKSSKRSSQKELWEFPKTKLKLTKGIDGKIQKEWSEKEDLESLKKYKNYIEAWCARNDFFVGKDNCVITLS